ncbi:protein preY [Striga asiatica]|uniref:Protein preY, mitochondrial n=1 Tax=Striga asiatica TaxID=4170 RepID=A0A5A7QFC8_STRAF|nr:protein preY [Striga asiatica]
MKLAGGGWRQSGGGERVNGLNLNENPRHRLTAPATQSAFTTPSTVVRRRNPSKPATYALKMVKGSGFLLKCTTGAGINATLAEILVCPLSKQPLRLCRQTNSLISDSIGVSYPIVDGIPRLVPTDGKVLDADETPISGNVNSVIQKSEKYLKKAHLTKLFSE